ncbi:DUF2007 domain-containing protein [Xanthovirga aplysinae]|uniref:putative signal transducing protein n=1 Tax=Xanthovirga aplysinae TaxID=2529853 RepID=UPI0012BD3316|nr:DUF2007 domain-containing protein [Xanthovirga aplysinae]MTI29386.1 DUF2007 domain-containing protein [Xanthovirga aplysinae]
MEKLVTIATFQNPVQANIYKGKLEAANIYCFLADENIVSVNWLFSNAIGGIKLQVAEKDAEKAKLLLEDNPKNAPSPEEDESINPSKNTVQCPKCRSLNIRKEKFSKEVASWSLIFLGFPLPFFSKTHHCFDCGHEWKNSDVPPLHKIS